MQKTQELADRAKANHDLKKVAKELGATVQDQRPGRSQRAGTRHWGPEWRRECRLHHEAGDISGPIQAGPNGAVLQLTERQEPSPSEVKQNWDKAKDTLLQQKRSEFEQLYVQNLRDRLEKQGVIKINKKEMDRLKSLSEGS